VQNPVKKSGSLEGEKMFKEFLSVLLIISAILVLGVQFNSYYQIPYNSLTSDTKNQLFAQILGLFLLFFVVFFVIWEIPETTTGKRTTFPETTIPETQTTLLETHGHRTEKKQIDFKEENTNEMLENGYVLNVETGKWEKPTT
jgi:hypothetical protein